MASSQNVPQRYKKTIADKANSIKAGPPTRRARDAPLAALLELPVLVDDGMDEKVKPSAEELALEAVFEGIGFVGVAGGVGPLKVVVACDGV